MTSGEMVSSNLRNLPVHKKAADNNEEGEWKLVENGRKHQSATYQSLLGSSLDSRGETCKLYVKHLENKKDKGHPRKGKEEDLENEAG